MTCQTEKIGVKSMSLRTACQSVGAFLGLTLLALAGTVPGAEAQSSFSPVLYVNDRVITQFEVDQRRRLLVLFRTQGDVAQQAVDQLIDDRLRLFAADQAGIEVTDEQMVEGMAEFAGRANLSTEQFLTLVGQQGVQPETFQDFIRAGLAWRGVVRGRFGPSAQVTDAEVDRAISNAAGGATGTLAIEYAEYLVNETDTGKLAKALSRLDTCDDLYGVAKGEPEETLQFYTLPPAEIPAAVKAELDQLDDGEISTRLTRGPALVILMMCGRTANFAEGVDRDTVRSALVNQRIGTYANGLLAELKADAIIREP